ncbi:MAG: hypothetical protein ACRDQZ_02175 [Mycobacteriales bacterium]
MTQTTMGRMLGDMQGLGILIVIVGMGVGAWYFIRSAVASGVRAARRDEKPGPPEDGSGSGQG